MAYCNHCGCAVPDGTNYCGGCVREVLAAREADRRSGAKGSNPYLTLIKPYLTLINPYLTLILPTVVGFVVTYPLWLFIFAGGDAGPSGRENWPLIMSGLVAFHALALLVLGRLVATRRLGVIIGCVLSIFSGWITAFAVGVISVPIYSAVQWLSAIR